MKRIATIALVLGIAVTTPIFGVRRDNMGCDYMVFDVHTSGDDCVTRRCGLASSVENGDGTVSCNYTCGDWEYCMTT